VKEPTITGPRPPIAACRAISRTVQVRSGSAAPRSSHCAVQTERARRAALWRNRARSGRTSMPVVVASADRILHTPKHGLQSSCSTADHLTPPARPDWRRDRGFESVSLQRRVRHELGNRLKKGRQRWVRCLGCLRAAESKALARWRRRPNKKSGRDPERDARVFQAI
jgi:hypothetical protein